MLFTKTKLTLFAVFSLTLPALAQHTFSICAVDTATGIVGSAGASCINNSVIISDVHSGIGVIHTQAQWFAPNQNTGKTLMNAGWDPQPIIDSLVAGDFNFGATNRQYGAVKIKNGSPLAAAFTGSTCIDYKNHIIGPYYTIQGNILAGQHILDSMEARFLRAEGDLACRLMAAMQGANVVGADSRCSSSGNSSLSSFIRVAMPGDDPDTPSINIIIPSGPAGYEPIDSLQVLFDLQHNCLQDTTPTAITASNHESMKIIPLPAEGIILISGNLPANAWIELYDTAGKQMLSEKIISRKVNVSRLPRATYVCRIKTGGHILYNAKATL